MDKDSILETLIAYKKLSEKQQNHEYLLDDKTVILFASTLLDGEDPEIISNCLDILENFIKNKEARTALIGIFGTVEALESLSMKMRNSFNKDLIERASKLLITLESNEDTRCVPVVGRTLLPKTNVYLLYVRELAPETGNKLEESLVKIHGVISFVTNVNKKSCRLRTYPEIPIKKIIIDIKKMCEMMPYLLCRNSENQELLIDVLEKNVVKCIDNKPQGDKNSKSSNVNWMQNISEFWSKSFYCNLSPENVSISINLDDTNNKIDDVNVADVAVGSIVAMDDVNILPILMFNSTDSSHVPDMQIDPSFELHQTYNIAQQISALEIPHDLSDLPINKSLSERHNVTENIPQEKIPNDDTPPQTFNNVVVHKTPDKMSQESLDGVKHLIYLPLLHLHNI
ncbi:hypothetical protein RN001_000379 [Aquatica leii]|uniref:Uncharacterized protein n=1 Tax=Aquatica leii TaxID=1421715 RepID=A0AAN7PF83_9COLE|nr:hypothetical protein RN001_000379 [Aquatica leii]